VHAEQCSLRCQRPIRIIDAASGGLLRDLNPSTPPKTNYPNPAGTQGHSHALLHAGSCLAGGAEERVHLFSAGGEDGAELVAVDGFGDFAAGVADEPGDLLDSDVAVGH
jgi:hypothetical protein